MEDLEIIKEFLVESDENLVRLDQEIIKLEADPKNPDLIASIFRTIHTIKGTCGFLGFDRLTEVSHAAESILSQVREGLRDATQDLINLILESVDAIKQLLKHIEETHSEGDLKFTDLVGRLQAFAENRPVPAANPIMAAEVNHLQVDSEDSPETEERESSESDSSPMPISTPVSSPKAVPPSKRVSEPAQPKSNSGEKPAAADSSIRVDVGLLNKLMNLVGELVLARNQVLQFSNKTADGVFLATSQRLNLITSELQENMMKTRLQPIGTVWGKFPRIVRDIATSINKQIVLQMDGAETELDRTIIEAIKDPLTHIIRNSCDHGIEKPEDRTAKGKTAAGKLSMRAFHEGGSVNIEIADDGAGIHPEKVKNKAVQKGLITVEQAARMSDREAINTIFLPGFSTAEQVSNISGRGVGMDVVKTNIEKIGGTVDLLSVPNQGTTLKIKIPLTLAIIPGLTVTSGGERFVIPQISLSELVRLEGSQAHKQIEQVHTATVYRRRGKLLPIVYLNHILHLQEQSAEEAVTNIVIVQMDGREFGVVVDAINDTQEIVVKPLGKLLKSLPAYSGATIMGDGQVALILDILGIAQLAGVLGESRPSQMADEDAENLLEQEQRETLLIFSAGPFERVAVPLRVVARLEEIGIGNVERAGGQMVTQYRGHILLLFPLSNFLDPSCGFVLPEEGVLQVVVFRHGRSLLGLIVDQIIDIVDETVAVKRKTEVRGLSGSAVIGQKVTDLLDLTAVFEYLEPIGMHDWEAPGNANGLTETDASLLNLSLSVNDSASKASELTLA